MLVGTVDLKNRFQKVITIFGNDEKRVFLLSFLITLRDKVAI